MMQKITPIEAQNAYNILVREAGARNDEREKWSFVHAVCHGQHPCEEYRFQGKLGFGGKFRNNGNRATPYVDCYPEHETAERLALIQTTNAALADLFANIIPGKHR